MLLSGIVEQNVLPPGSLNDRTPEFTQLLETNFIIELYDQVFNCLHFMYMAYVII